MSENEATRAGQAGDQGATCACYCHDMQLRCKACLVAPCARYDTPLSDQRGREYMRAGIEARRNREIATWRKGQDVTGRN